MKHNLKQHLQQAGKPLFFPYLTYGFPDESTFFQCLHICAEEGADAVEVGIPHSDPVADGPVIQGASQVALARGVTPRKMIEAFSRYQSPVPLIAMTYGNIVYRYGTSQFVTDLAGSGFSGLIVADFPLEARALLPDLADQISIPLLVATTTGVSRLERIARISEGFIYFVSGKGTTGSARPEFTQARRLIEHIRRLTDTPVMMGFGIDCPEKAKEAAWTGDGAIVGSALIQFIDQHHQETDFPSTFSSLIRSYRQAIDQAQFTAQKPDSGPVR